MAAQSLIFSSPALEGLYDTAEERQANNEQLLHNIYDATPDHSILKHGLAKSLSTFDLGNAIPEHRHHLPSSNPNSSYKRNKNKTQRTPRHLIKKKNQACQLDPHQSLPSLTTNLNVLTENSRKLANSTDFLMESFPTDSESSATESQQDLGLDFTGFEKTRDFGDFVIFSNSPGQMI